MGALFIMAKASSDANITLTNRNWKRHKILSNESLSLNTDILDDSKNRILALVQPDVFVSELHNLRIQLQLAKISKILPLSLILINSFMKVGGHIRYSNTKAVLHGKNCIIRVV